MTNRLSSICFVSLLLALTGTRLSGQCCLNGPNLLSGYNADFSAPYSTIPPGFQNDNTYTPIPAGGGTYLIVASRNFGSCAATPQMDHTTGDTTGRFLWFDTGPTASVTTPACAWRPYNPNLPPGQENLIAVTPNTTYVFSCWVRDLSRNTDCLTGGAPIAGLRINGVSLAQVDLWFFLNPCCPQWIQLCAQWQSGSETIADLRIESRRGSGWTDLGIDDVYFGSPVPLPVHLGNDTVLCSGQSLTLKDSTAGATYLWSTGSTTSSLTVSNPNLYWLAKTQGACSGRDSILITQVLPPMVTLGNDTILCNGASSLLMPSLSGGAPVNMLWQDNSTGATFTASQTGLYWFEANNECGADRDSVIITQLAAPVVALGNDTLLCSGTPYPITPLLSGGAPASYQWQDNSTGATASASATGLYWVRVENQCGISVDSVSLNFQNDVTPFSLGNDTVLCNGGSFSLSPVPVPSGSFTWQDGSSMNTFANAENGLFWLEVRGLCGAHRDSILVSSFTTAPFTLSGDTIFCSGNSVEICAPDSFISYLWNTGDNRSCTPASFAGDYWVSVTASNGCSVVSLRKKMETYPVPSVSIIRNGDTLASYNAASYQWYLDGVKIEGATSAVYIALQPGSYTVQITDANGCPSNSTAVIVTGLDDPQQETGFMLFPNPATHQLFIQTTGFSPFVGLGALSIFNINGRKLSEEKFSPIIDISSLSPGVYFLELKNAGTLARKRWVKM